MENIIFALELLVACAYYLVHIPWNHIKANKKKKKEQSNL